MGGIDVRLSDDLLALAHETADRKGMSTRAWAREIILVELGREIAAHQFDERLSEIERVLGLTGE